MANTIAVVMTVYDPSLPGDRTLRFCSGVGFVSSAGDIFTPRLSSNPVFSIAVSEQSSVVEGYGSFSLANADGALDGYINYTFRGKTIKIYRTSSTTLSISNLVFDGTMEDAEFDDQSIEIRYRSRSLAADKPVIRNFYAGTGALEGPEGLKGVPKPLVFGRVNNFSPILVDPAKLIYHVADHFPGAATFTSVGHSVYDSGVSLTLGTAYTDVAQMNSTSPAAGQARVLNAQDSGSTGIYFRLGSIPTGEVTCDVTAYSVDTGFADYVNALLLASDGVQALYADDYAADASYIGAVIRDQITTSEALAGVAGFKWITRYPDSATSVSKWAIRDIVDPETATGSTRLFTDGTARVAFVVEGQSIIACSRVVGASVPAPAGPVKRVSLRFDRIHTVQTSGLAASVTAERRQRLAQEYREIPVTDATVTTAFPLADELTVYTAYGSFLIPNPLGGPDYEIMTTLAERWLELFKVRRDVFQVRTRLEPFFVCQHIPGDIVTIQNFARYDLTSPRKFILMGYEIDLNTGITELLLWG